MSAGTVPPTVGQACDARPEGAPEGALTLIHRNNCSNPIGMRVSRDSDPVWMAAHLRAPVGLWGAVCGPRIKLFRDGEKIVFRHLHERRADGTNTH